MKVTDEMIDAAAIAVRTSGGCGLSLKAGGPTVFCDHADLPDSVRDPDCSCKSGARAALEAALAAAPVGKVKVRYLVWEHPTTGPDEYKVTAKAIGCEYSYEIDNWGNERKPYRVSRTSGINPFKWAETVDSAKAFAQADFAARILSAIEEN